MIIVMKKRAKQKDLDSVIRWIESVGYRAHLSKGVERTIIGAVGDERRRKGNAHLTAIQTCKPRD